MIIRRWLYFLPGNVAGQFTEAHPACPGDAFTFSCTVVGNMSGFTTWRVNRSSECPLSHITTTSSTICGPSNAFTAKPGTGYETSATLFSSTLSGTADPALNGMLVECFGPDNNVNPGNRIDEGTLQVLGKLIWVLQCCIEISRPTKWCKSTSWVFPSIIIVQTFTRGYHSCKSPDGSPLEFKIWISQSHGCFGDLSTFQYYSGQGSKFRFQGWHFLEDCALLQST